MSLISPAHVVLLQKSWQAISGMITALLVTYFLSPNEQGYYYSIGSLLSVYILLDMGLSGLLVQVVARIAPDVEGARSGVVAKVVQANSELLTLIRWSRRWYAILATVFLLIAPLGYFYFDLAHTELPVRIWQMPWIAGVICVALSIPAYPMQSIVEGLGRVSEVYFVRLAQYVLGATAAWSLLSLGYGLYAPAMVPLAVTLVTLIWSRVQWRNIFWARESYDTSVSWRESLRPLQRKVAVTWVANYMFLNLPTLIVFYLGDAINAGRLGLSIVIANLLGSLCASWLIAKVPRITHLVAIELHTESNALFFVEFGKSLVLMIVGYACVAIIALLLSGTDFEHRILDPIDLILLFGSFSVFHSIMMLSVYFRARGREMLGIPLMTSTLLGITGASIGVVQYGIRGVLVALLLAFALIALPGMYWAWKNQ